MHEDLSLNAFTAIDRVEQLRTYIDALAAFDQIEQLQELKRIERALVRPSSSVLDIGCGFGLETVRLARVVAPGKGVCGIDKSAHFIEEARKRARAEGLDIDYRAGSADALPYADASFDHVRAERLLIYFDDVRPAAAEMKRVLRPGGTLALVEPDFGTTTINLQDRALVRRVMAHEADTSVAQSWLPGRLHALLTDAGFIDIAVSTRVVILPQDLAAEYFSGVARKAAQAGAISRGDLETWQQGLDELHRSGRLFGTESYFLFTARG